MATAPDQGITMNTPAASDLPPARLPVLFVSHGSPMHALQPGAVAVAWKGFADSLPRPRAILIASAHWETGVPMLTGSDRPDTIHDFYGFPEALDHLRYPAPGSADLAREARDLLKAAGICAGIDGTHGLDHGSWSPLLHLFPEADIPVVQLSVQPSLGTLPHLALGRGLRTLRDQGVLIIGSGHMTHNLREGIGAMRSGRTDLPALPYVAEFVDWVGQRIEKREPDLLANYRQLAPHAARAHPGEEHFLPLFIALGAAGEDYRPQRIYHATELQSLAMDAWAFH